MDTEAEAAAFRQADHPPRVRSLFDAARHVRGRRLHVGGQDHRSAVRAAGLCTGSAQGRHRQGRHAGAQGRQSAHLLLGFRFQHRAPDQRLSHPYRRRQRHPSASRVEVGSFARSQDLDAHHGGHDLARRPQVDGRRRRLEHQALPRSQRRFLGGRPDEGLHAQGDRHRQEGRQGQRRDDDRACGTPTPSR